MDYLKKINKESVVQQVIDCLTEAMLSKQLKPGDKIPTENELSESLGVGRSTIREAIKILVYIGVLEIRRAEGTYVCEGFSEAMIDPMLYGIILAKEEEYGSLIELRELTEVGIVNLAAKKRDPQQLKAVHNKLLVLKEECLKEDFDVQKAFDADNQFHDAVMAMGQNHLVEKINGVVRILTHSMRFQTVSRMIETGRGRELYEAHEKIYQMIQDGLDTDLNIAIRETYFL